jgi:hypothetical protein
MRPPARHAATCWVAAVRRNDQLEDISFCFMGSVHTVVYVRFPFPVLVLSFPKKRPPCRLNHPTEHPAFLFYACAPGWACGAGRQQRPNRPDILYHLPAPCSVCSRTRPNNPWNSCKSYSRPRQRSLSSACQTSSASTSPWECRPRLCRTLPTCSCSSSSSSASQECP